MKKGLVRIKFFLKGKNLNLLPEFLHKKSVTTYYFKLKSDNQAEITVDYNDKRKFFAICKNMCYNIYRKVYIGILSPFLLLFENIGITVGVLFAVIILVFSNNILLSVNLTGSGSCFKGKIYSVLSDLGVEKYTLFSKLDYKLIEREILNSSDRLSFVSVKKQGNRLIIDSVLSEKEPETLSACTKPVTSSYNGVIEKINVLRGTKLKNVGDTCTVGEELVGNYVLGKDGTKYDTYVLCTVQIKTEKEVCFEIENPTEEDKNICEVKAEFFETGEVISKRSEISNNIVKVYLTVIYTVYGG